MSFPEVGWRQVGRWISQNVSLRELLQCLASSFCHPMAISLLGRRRCCLYECPCIGASLIGVLSISCIGRESGPLSPSPVHTHTGLTLLQRYDKDTRLIGPSVVCKTGFPLLSVFEFKRDRDPRCIAHI